MWKFEDIPAIGKQDKDRFHPFERLESKHGQIKKPPKTQNGTIWLLDPKQS